MLSIKKTTKPATSSRIKTHFGHKEGINMTKKATITIQLVPESQTQSNEKVKREIAKSLECDWLLKIQNIKIEE